MKFHSPKVFLNNKILKNKNVETTLRKWTDLRNMDFMTRFVEKTGVRTPSIWMLTALYELEDATCFFTKEQSISPSVGIGAEIMALLGAPVGGSISTQHGTSLSTRSTLPGTSVWAAQYKLLDLRYVRVAKGQPLPPLTLPVEVRNTLSEGQMLGSDDEDDENEATDDCVVKIAVAGEGESEAVDPEAYDQIFWNRMDEAEELWVHAGDG